MTHRITIGCTAIAFLLVSVCGWSADPAGPETSEPASTPSIVEDGDTEILLDESFEESDFPELPWRVSPPAAGAAEVNWGRTQYRATAGPHSIYCAGTGPDAPGDGGPVPANTASWTIVGPYDLSETTAGTLTFNLWLRTEQYQDVFMWLVSTDGQSYSGSAKSTDTSGWQTVTTDLSNWGAAGNVIGETEVWIAFVYQSDHNNLFEGAYIDEVMLTVDVGTPGDEGRTYTTNADFSEGVMVGLESTSDELELTDDWDALPFLWVPNSVTGTVSKVDAETGDELGRYRTGPNGDVDPGVAAVDLEGSCWVGNRGAGTVVKIGLLENGGCFDRDGSGEIETSTDRNSDGDISGSEILDWGDDECVLIETVLVEGFLGPHVPGDGHEDYEANNLQAVAVDANGDVWVGVYDTNYLYHLDSSSGDINDQVDVSDEFTFPTSAVVDSTGSLWVSSWPDQWVLELEPATGDTNRIDLSHGSSGLAINGNDDLFVTGYEHRLFSKIDTELNEFEWRQTAGYLADGIATSQNGRIWVAAAGEGTVSRYTPGGESFGFVSVQGGPTGLAVDQDGKVWVIGNQTDTIYRIDPNSVISDLQKTLLGTSGHAATGDLTGVVVRNLTSRFGTWTVVYDSQVAGTPWGVISWQAQKPAGTSVVVRVRSSEDADNWSAWEPSSSGQELGLTPSGRYLEIQASLQKVDGDEFPKLQELTVVPATVVVVPEASFTWSPPTPTVGESTQFTDTSSGEPTSWSWNFGDGETSDQQNPSHIFEAEGSVDVSLTATNDAGSDTVSNQVTVGPESGCTLTCAAAVPSTADLSESVSFQASAQASDCTGAINYTWSFGDGSTSDEQNPTYEYSSTGTLRWGMTATADSVSCTRSGDITVSGAGPEECDLTYWVPVISRGDGLNGSVWRSDLGLLGSDPAGAAVELRFHGSGSSASRVVTVAPDAMVNLTDVVEWLDPDFSGSGALEICSDGELVVDSRTYNVLAADHDCFPGGTFGQHLSGAPGESGLTALEVGRLGHLRETADFRTNIGFVNTGTAVATVVVDLVDATGAELESFTMEIQPGQWHQENRPFYLRAGRQDLDAASARVWVVVGDGIFAYASVIDNLTNDATTVPMRR